jgi:hypothetical protein
MSEKSQEELLDEILDRFLGPQKFNALAPRGLGGIPPRLDVSKPNIHDSKKEFLREKNAVANVIELLNGVLSQVLGKKDDVEHKEMIGRLQASIDQGATRSMRSLDVSSASDLAIRNVMQTGFYYGSLFVILEMIGVYKERLRELDDQERQFWTVSNRPPNYYARTIALRLARLFAKEKRQKPTFGISREGNYPSTVFGRALEQVFCVLKIKASVRNAAEWAIDQLQEDDWNPRQNALAGLGSILGAPDPKPSKDPKDAIAELLVKRSSK